MSDPGRGALTRLLARVRHRVRVRSAVCGARWGLWLGAAALIPLAAGAAWGLPWTVRLTRAAATLPLLGGLVGAVSGFRVTTRRAARVADDCLGGEELFTAAVDQAALPPAKRAGGAGVVLARADRAAQSLFADLGDALPRFTGRGWTAPAAAFLAGLFFLWAVPRTGPFDPSIGAPPVPAGQLAAPETRAHALRERVARLRARPARTGTRDLVEAAPVHRPSREGTGVTPADPSGASDERSPAPRPPGNPDRPGSDVSGTALEGSRPAAGAFGRPPGRGRGEEAGSGPAPRREEGVPEGAAITEVRTVDHRVPDRAPGRSGSAGPDETGLPVTAEEQPPPVGEGHAQPAAPPGRWPGPTLTPALRVYANRYLHSIGAPP